jgi:accessory gene regulator protein AgrB
VEVREDHGILVAVIGMNIALAHILKMLLIVSLTVLSLIGWLLGLLRLSLEVLHFSLERSLKLGLHVERHGERAVCRGKALVQE